MDQFDSQDVEEPPDPTAVPTVTETPSPVYDVFGLIMSSTWFIHDAECEILKCYHEGEIVYRYHEGYYCLEGHGDQPVWWSVSNMEPPMPHGYVGNYVDRVRVLHDGRVYQRAIPVDDPLGAWLHNGPGHTARPRLFDRAMDILHNGTEEEREAVDRYAVYHTDPDGSATGGYGDFIIDWNHTDSSRPGTPRRDD